VTLLLKLSQLIDWLIERVGKGAFWLVLVMTVISASNAVFALFSTTVQTACWKFSGICSPPYSCSVLALHAAKKRARPDRRDLQQVLGTRPGHHRHHRHLFFLLPMVVMVLWLSLPLVADSIKIKRNVGQCRRPDSLAGKNPAADRLCTLLALQGISELIKRLAFLGG
jgi:TRAP-type mannitol/chloroaromatic compound transport system permease small subunit